MASGTSPSVVVATHGHCFDGMCSAARFTRLARSQMGEDASFTYRACGYGPEQGGVDAALLTGDEECDPDFAIHGARSLPGTSTTTKRRSHRPKTGPTSRPRAPEVLRSQVQLLLEAHLQHSREQFGLGDSPDIAELVRWADIIDAARFPSAEMAVLRAEPALWLMTVVGELRRRRLSLAHRSAAPRRAARRHRQKSRDSGQMASPARGAPRVRRTGPLEESRDGQRRLRRSHRDAARGSRQVRHLRSVSEEYLLGDRHPRQDALQDLGGLQSLERSGAQARHLPDLSALRRRRPRGSRRDRLPPKNLSGQTESRSRSPTSYGVDVDRDTPAMRPTGARVSAGAYLGEDRAKDE